MTDLFLKNIRIVSPSDKIDKVTDLYITDGIIRKIGKVSSLKKSVREINCKNKTCIPGLFDMHVHFREPGQTHKEDLNSGAEAAANGGFTGVLCMPNTLPAVDSPLLLRDLKSKSNNLIVDIEFSACATMKREGEIISPVLSLSEAGAVAFTDDGSPVHNPEIMRRVLEYTSQVNAPVIQHCEDMKLTNGGVINEGFISTSMGVRGIPEISETSIIARDILITEFVKNSKYHVQHISCGKSVELVRNAKSRNIRITSEVCPHHFILTDKKCTDFDSNYKMNPPLRTAEDVESVLKGLQDGTIDVICTDHAPHTDYEKNQSFYDAPFGIIGLETSVGLVYTFLVSNNIISFELMIEKMSINPRNILGLDEIHISEGESANLTILNTNETWIVDKDNFKSKSRNTPFDGYQLKCKPFCVINNNQIYFSKL